MTPPAAHHEGMSDILRHRAVLRVGGQFVKRNREPHAIVFADAYDGLNEKVA